MLWRNKGAPGSAPSAQCPPWPAALARLSPSPSSSALPRVAGTRQGRLPSTTSSVSLGRQHDPAHWGAAAARLCLLGPRNCWVEQTRTAFTGVQEKGRQQQQPLFTLGLPQPRVMVASPQGWPEEVAVGVSPPAWHRGSLAGQAVTQAAASPGGTPGAGGTPSSRGDGDGRAFATL